MVFLSSLNFVDKTNAALICFVATHTLLGISVRAFGWKAAPNQGSILINAGIESFSSK